jgi:mannose-6-phosphate isomerase
MVHALKFDPIYKERLWGGRNLETLLGRSLPAGVKIGESWDLADLPVETSRVAAGPSKGKRLDELVHSWGSAILGSVELDAGQFPLLVKFLDAQDVLSVQVHPDYKTATAMGGDVRAKYEAWYVLSAEPNACIYRGFKPGVTHQAVKEAIETNELAELLVKWPARPGDWFYLPGGTVHALGSGLVVAEVQTPSDTTFRLYDWGRVDPKTGKGRQLHIEQGLACLEFDGIEPHIAQGSTQPETTCKLVDSRTFLLHKSFKPAGSRGTLDVGQPIVWIVLAGSGSLGDKTFALEFNRGEVILVPAGVQQMDFVISSDCSYLHVDLKRQM